MTTPTPDLLEHGREPRVRTRRPSAGVPVLPALLGLAVAIQLAAAGVVVSRHEEQVPAASTATATDADAVSRPATRRSLPLPPGRPRRDSPAQVDADRADGHAQAGSEVGAPGTPPAFVAATSGARPGEVTARTATFAVAGDYCDDVSLLRLRLLRRDDSWSDVAYYVAVYEDRPRNGSFVIQLTWTGKGYDYFVTGPAGECRPGYRG